MINSIIIRLKGVLKIKWVSLSKSLQIVPIFLLISLTLASGKFDGDTILHHVVNDKHTILYEIHDPFFGIDLSISKHVLMLWIVAFLTISISLYATRIYRQDGSVRRERRQSRYVVLGDARSGQRNSRFTQGCS